LFGLGAGHAGKAPPIVQNLKSVSAIKADALFAQDGRSH
jgi:hypothetical protein